MRIAYIAYLTGRTGEGVRSKLAAQVAAWQQEGHDVTVAILSPDATAPDGVPTQVFRSDGLRRRPSATLALVRAARRLEADVAYVRYDVFVPPLALGPRQPVVLEINTDDRSEFALRGRAVRLYNALNRRIAFADADGAVFVTGEMASSPSFAAAPGRRVVVPNGIDLAAVRPTPPPGNEQPRFAFVGHDSRWQGFDKVVRLAEKLPASTFEIVGVPTFRLGRLPANVVVHEALRPAGVQAVLARCDVGLGTLALHRKGMDEACALKVREYLGHGLPTVLANRDPDFPGEPPWFLLRLPNREDNIEAGAEAIGRFAAGVQGRRVDPAEISHLDLREKERRRLDFMARVAARD